MAIVAECPACGKRFKADESKAGKKAKCSKCGEVFVIGPGAAPSATTGSVNVGALSPATGLRRTAAEVKGTTANANAPSPTATAVTAATAPSPKAARPRPVETAAKPDIESEQIAPAAAAPAPVVKDTQPKPGGRRGKILMLIAALLLIGGAAAAVVGPRLLGKGASTSQADKKRDNAATPGGAWTEGGAAWSAQPDGRAAALKLPDDFRMAIPAQAPLRHDPASLVIAASPGPMVAVTLLPDAGAALVPTIEVWHLETRQRTAQFRLNQLLVNPVLSADSAYYAGQLHDSGTRTTRAEIWSTANGTEVHRVEISSTEAIAGEVVLGFPVQDQVAIYGDKLAVWDLTSKRPVREVSLPPRSPDTRAAASARVKLVAVADSRSLTLVDLENARVVGSTKIPETARAHPRQALSLRSIGFSSDGSELALVFDNRQSTRRIAVYDVATGALKVLQTPVAVVQNGGPPFQWMPDSQGFLVGAGVLLDRAAARQVGQVYTDLPEEGLGGSLVGLLEGEHALAAWDKFPKSLALRSIPARRERPQWLKVNIASASAARYEQLPCVGREFGNASTTQALVQNGRLTDGSQFLVVATDFTASLAADAPPTVPLRADQFVLVADGQPRLPIGMLTREGSLSLERPSYALRKAITIPRKRSLVFAVSGAEKSLTLQIASAHVALTPPAAVAVQPTPPLISPPTERLPAGLFTANDDAGAVSVRVNWARARAYDDVPEAADSVPLQVSYTSPRETVIAVNFELTANLARAISRGGSLAPPRLGLLLADGTHLRPAIELPGPLPVTLGAGERRTQTCLFVVPAAISRARLTYEDLPVATVNPAP
ncbi:MAG: hypothetical protein JWN40_45 [Phycisphaerales bacterium]|nr:hypothetical protein [Phycisphaerales bacterium]